MSWHAPISLLTRILLRIVIHCLQCSFVNNNNNTVPSKRVTGPRATRVSCQQHKTPDCNKNCLNNASTTSYHLRLFHHKETVMQLLIKPSCGPSPCHHCMISHNLTFFTPFPPINSHQNFIMRSATTDQKFIVFTSSVLLQAKEQN